MGTSNFHNVNASRIYAICEPYEYPVLDDDENETGEMELYYPDSIEYHGALDYVRERMADAVENRKDSIKYDYFNWVKQSGHELRSYPCTYIGSLRATRVFGDIGVDLHIHAFARSGYYSAANLDWELEVVLDEISCGIDDLDGPIEYIVDSSYSNMGKGLRTIMSIHAEKWIKKQTEILRDILEAVFVECSSPYIVVARFSNGETMYEKVQ